MRRVVELLSVGRPHGAAYFNKQIIVPCCSVDIPPERKAGDRGDHRDAAFSSAVRLGGLIETSHQVASNDYRATASEVLDAACAIIAAQIEAAGSL